MNYLLLKSESLGARSTNGQRHVLYTRLYAWLFVRGHEIRLWCDAEWRVRVPFAKWPTSFFCGVFSIYRSNMIALQYSLDGHAVTWSFGCLIVFTVARIIKLKSAFNQLCKYLYLFTNVLANVRHCSNGIVNSVTHTKTRQSCDTTRTCWEETERPPNDCGCVSRRHVLHAVR